MVFNAYHDPVKFTLPASTPDSDADARWKLMIDTNIRDLPAREPPVFTPRQEYDVTGRSFLTFVLQGGATVKS